MVLPASPLPSSSSIPTYLVDSFTGGGLETWIRRSKHWQHLCVSNGEGEAGEDRENGGENWGKGKAQEPRLKREWEGSWRGYLRSGTYPSPSTVSFPHNLQSPHSPPLLFLFFDHAAAAHKAQELHFETESRWWVQVAGCRRCQTQPNSVWLTARHDTCSTV